MLRGRQFCAVVLIWALSISTAGAYYQFIHYTSKSAPYLPIPEKFDLRALPSQTVTFFVSDAGPAQYAPNDSFPAVLSQMRQAARTWNGVSTSALRVTFGGLYSLDTPQAVPGGEIVFDDEIPPGLLAFSTHTVATAPIQGGDGNFFFPITRAIIHMHQDLTQLPGPSFSEGFFLTVVHEMGHALGLQHTFTSSVMSTAVTRGVTLLHPLDADDMAAISLLYPNNVAALTGSISGTVTAGGVGVHLASVVAIRAGGGAVSALSNPDGTYQIQGIPPGQYFLYVHPLPTTANIVFPLDPDGNTVNPSGPFTPVFYPNTPNLPQATAISVTAGSAIDGKDFSVQPRSDLLISDISTYSYFGNNAVHPAFLSTSTGIGTFVAAGNGLGANGFAAQGLGMQVMGGSILVRPGGLRGYGSTPTYLAVDLQFGLGVTTGRQHLVFTRDNYLYVLPSGLNLVTKQPPSIATVIPATDGSSTVAITGDNLAPGSQVYFDGLPGTTTIIDAQHASVVPPPGASGQRATVTAFSQDGQNSVFIASATLPTYQYAMQAAAPAVTISPNNLPAGSEAMVDITGTNTNFVAGLTTIGFGSSDVFVRRLWVLSPTHVIANVAVLPPAPVGSTTISAISGFQVFTQKAGFQANANDPTLPVLYPQLINGIWLPSGVYPGAIASLFGVNLGDANSNTRITMNGERVTLLYVSPGQINLVVPADLKIGPVVLTLNNGSKDAYPVVMAIDPAPPVISAVLNQAGGGVASSAAAVQLGDTLTVAVAGLSGTTAPGPGSVHIIVGGVDHQTNTISQPLNGVSQVQFTLAANVPAGDAVPLTVSVNGLTSLPVYISIHPAN